MKGTNVQRTLRRIASPHARFYNTLQTHVNLFSITCSPQEAPMARYVEFPTESGDTILIEVER